MINYTNSIYEFLFIATSDNNLLSIYTIGTISVCHGVNNSSSPNNTVHNLLALSVYS